MVVQYLALEGSFHSRTNIHSGGCFSDGYGDSVEPRERDQQSLGQP